MENIGKACRLCLKSCGKGFEIIDECTSQILDKLLLKLDLAVSEEPMMCRNCAENLQSTFDFKSLCLSTENRITSFARINGFAKVSLENVYISNNREVADIPEGHSVCRFCLTLIKSGSFACLDDDIKEMVEVKVIVGKCFPELNLSITEEPLICISCQKSLKACSEFITNCPDIKNEVRQECYMEPAINGSPGELASVLEFKHDCKDAKVIKFEDCPIKEKNNEGAVKLDLEEQNLYLKDEEIDIKMEQSDTEVEQISCNRTRELTQEISNKGVLKVERYKCDLCLYETPKKYSIKHHALTHLSPSEVPMYKCELCPYESKYKGNLKYHMIVHKEASEIPLHTCHICGYQTKHKYHLAPHMLKHKPRTEVTMLKCASCRYETKNKCHLKQHMMVHLDTTVYKCAHCTYEAKHKRCFKRHLLTHKKSSEVTMYKCENCAFETKRKESLKQHQLTHKNASEITMYKCGVCTYKAKTKGNLKVHMLKHRKRRK